MQHILILQGSNASGAVELRVPNHFHLIIAKVFPLWELVLYSSKRGILHSDNLAEWIHF
jgi:hypothetical protein